MPTATIDGINRHPVFSVRNNTIPTAIHITATTVRNRGLDGRRPMATGLSGSNGARRAGGTGGACFVIPPFGVTRPLESRLRWRAAMYAEVSPDRAPRRG
jgi:hypothetical protein